MSTECLCYKWQASRRRFNIMTKKLIHKRHQGKNGSYSTFTFQSTGIFMLDVKKFDQKIHIPSREWRHVSVYTRDNLEWLSDSVKKYIRYRASNYHFAKDIALTLLSTSGEPFASLFVIRRSTVYVEVVKRRAIRKAAMTSTERFVIADEKMPGAVCEAYLSQTASSDIQYVIVTLSQVVNNSKNTRGTSIASFHKPHPHRDRHTDAREP